MTLYLGSLQRVLLRFSDLRLLWVMYILGAVCLHLRHGGYDVSGFFLGEAGGLSAGICLVFPYPGCWRYGPLLCCPFRWAAPGTLRVSLMMVGPFSILFQICDFPFWEVICPLGLISRFLFFFLISSKVEFGFVDSFIVFIWGSYCVWDMLDSCDCNT